MANLNAKNFSLNVARDIERLLKHMRMLYSQNSNLVENLENEQLFYMHDKTHSDFYFYISAHERDTVEKKTTFGIYFAPQDSEYSNGTSVFCDIDQITEYFNNWISIIKEFNSVYFTEEQSFLKFYEEEFFSEFEIIEEDASYNPFGNDQQIYLFRLLEHVSNELKSINSNEPIILEIISETNELKDNIQNLSKKDIVKRISSIFARIKKFSLKLSIEIFDVAKKEIIKKCLYGGLDDISHLIDKF